MMKNGIVFFRFKFVVSRDDVIWGGIFYFDKNFVVVKVWFLDLEFFKSKFNSVLIWVKFYGFDVKYWSVVGFSKIESVVDKRIFVDMNIYRKISINFVSVDWSGNRILIEG